MNKTHYDAVRSWVTKSKLRYNTFVIIYKWLPLCIFTLYIIVTIYLAITRNRKIIPFLLVPGFMFVTLTLARKMINRPRPYEVYGNVPIVEKDKKGQSFPSRHSASAVAVACAVMYINMPLGMAAMAAAIFICASRVIGGVHFVSDVVVGICYALVFS